MSLSPSNYHREHQAVPQSAEGQILHDDVRKPHNISLPHEQLRMRVGISVASAQTQSAGHRMLTNSGHHGHMR